MTKVAPIEADRTELRYRSPDDGSIIRVQREFDSRPAPKRAGSRSTANGTVVHPTLALKLPYDRRAFAALGAHELRLINHLSGYHEPYDPDVPFRILIAKAA
jgi:hypothetical protein